MPKLRTRNGKFHADLYYLDAQGKRRRMPRSTGIRDDGTTLARRTAEQVARELEAKLTQQRPHERGRAARKVPLRLAYEALIEIKRTGQRAPATLKQIADKAIHPMRHFGTERDIVARPITAEELAQYAAKARQKRAPGTVHLEILRLREALRNALGEAPKAPDLGRIYTPRERALTPQEFSALLAHLNPRWREHAIVYRQLGLTYGEIERITTRDIGLLHNTIRIRGTKRETRDRLMPMPAQTRAILERRMRGAAPEKQLFERWDNANANRALTRAAQQAGLASGPGAKPERISFNVLRASFCTELVLRDINLKKIANLMGHATTAMVERVYARLRVDDLQSAMQDTATYPTEAPAPRKGRPPGSRNARPSQTPAPVANTSRTGRRIRAERDSDAGKDAT